MKTLIVVPVILAGLVVLGVIIWAIFLRKRMTFGEAIRRFFSLLFAPIRWFLGLFGGGITVDSGPAAPDVTPSPSSSGSVEVVRHEVGGCPPCELECPDPLPPTDTKPYEMEIRYLKDMVKFVGSIAKRENAINAQYRELYPGFSVMSPHVRRLSHEYNFLKNQLREDENEWTYFKNYFTKLSGIPSASSAVHYDIAF